MPGVCYSALRRLPRRDLHPLEKNGVKQTMIRLLRHDAPWREFYQLRTYLFSGVSAQSRTAARQNLQEKGRTGEQGETALLVGDDPISRDIAGNPERGRGETRRARALRAA
jgi:hypothetical protein